MPIVCHRPLKPLNREEFGTLSYGAFGDVLTIRKELGRFFDEKHYKAALEIRRSDVLLEVPILVSHGSFEKYHFIDVLLTLGGILEFKAAERVTSRHKAQLLHYLMLVDLQHGMLINVRPEKVTREFVNNVLTHKDRLQFEITTHQWKPLISGAANFAEVLTAVLHDWGTCLDLGLYEAALTHFLGGEAMVLRPAMVSLDGHQLGPQPLRFAADRTAFKLTAFAESGSQTSFRDHAQKLVNHTDLDALLWANIGRHQVSLHCLTPSN